MVDVDNNVVELNEELYLVSDDDAHLGMDDFKLQERSKGRWANVQVHSSDFTNTRIESSSSHARVVHPMETRRRPFRTWTDP